MVFEYIERKTEELLTQYGLLSLPINAKKLAEKLGVKVEAENFDDDVSGLFVMKDGVPYVIYNSNQGAKRRRFTIAHELGHFILHSKYKPLFVDKQGVVMYRNSESSTGELIKEREANAFAAALLMPKKLVEAEFSEAEDFEIVVGLAKKFNVSTQAMSFRLSNLGYDFGMF